ncbi:MAG: hypothetical protein LBL62_08765, partial [Planctomycetaceae bacterium]|nr:hypothetical protein [Planctomycetaceae bacterium]
KAVLKFAKLNMVAQQREAVTRGRSLLPYRLRYILQSVQNKIVSIYGIDSLYRHIIDACFAS